MSKVEDPCVRECFSPNSQWKFVDISECIARCKELNVIKP